MYAQHCWHCVPERSHHATCSVMGTLTSSSKKEHEVLMGKWICNSYLEGEPYTLQFTFHKNGKVNVREIFEGDDFSTEMLFNIEGDLSEGAEVIIFGGKGMDGRPAEARTFIVTVNGDEAIFIEDGEEMVFKREE